MMNGCPARRAFTLIELLVVIAILAMLATLLIPAVSQGLQAAYASDCKNVLRQTGTAVSSFRDDNDNYYPPGKGRNGLWYQQSSWANGDQSALRTWIAPYLGTEKVTNAVDTFFRCKAALRNMDPKLGSAYVANHAARVSATEKISVWGIKDAAAPLNHPKREASVQPDQYMLSDFDQIMGGTGFGNYNALPRLVSHRTYRNALFFDLSVKPRPLSEGI